VTSASCVVIVYIFYLKILGCDTRSWSSSSWRFGGSECFHILRQAAQEDARS